MPKIVVGPGIEGGLRTDRLPFNIDNDTFPVMLNAYQWRGRILRKRGNYLLGRLNRILYNFPTVNIAPLLGTTDVNGNFSGNLFTILAGLGTPFPTGGTIVPGSVGIHINTDGTFTDGTISVPTPGILSAGGISTGSIDYVGGNFSVNSNNPAFAGQNVHLYTLNYYPNLPVMGIEDFVISPGALGTLAFDTTYSYNISDVVSTNIYDVSFYKNPLTAAYPAYVEKSTATPLNWNGANYQQFYTTNYQGALWATNGISNPFNAAIIGMQYAPASEITAVTRVNSTTMTFVITGNILEIGDFVFANEFTSSPASNATFLNFQTGYVTNVIGTTVTVTFPYADIPAGSYTAGILQYLTNSSDTGIDCIRWYDGDPTAGGGLGWVNFMPPISQFANGIDDLPPGQYYLVGCRLIVPFKDRLLFMGPIVTTSSPTFIPVYLQDAIIYSQNGTPFYTASFDGDPALITTTFNPILVPKNQTATPGAYWSDAAGFGGFVIAGVDLPITTSGPNQDALIIGFDPSLQTKLVYTGNDLLPFEFYSVNSELGSSGTFSTIIMDQGILTYGKRGFVISNQTGTARIDIPILDQVFEINLTQSGNFRMTAQRDFVNEWVYFTYPSNSFAQNNDESVNPFNSQTLLYNYRDNSWAIFNESFTTYGQIKVNSGWTWATIGQRFAQWQLWNEPWNAGQTTALQPQVAAGNQQGFIFIRSDETYEAPSLFIQSISGNTITSPFHTLVDGDYITISGAIGTIAPSINGQIFQVEQTAQNTFVLAGSTLPSGTYLGAGLITRMYQPFVQSRQFPVAWAEGRKTRIGPMQFLLETTPNGQISVLVFLSQNTIESPYVSNSINNDALVYTNTVFTCPESTNLGLTPFNSNLQQANYPVQQQIWHRVNTSLIGDTVQIGFWLSDEQMQDITFSNQFEEIIIHSFILDVNQSQMLS